MENLAKNLARNLKKLRADQTQRAFARKLGVSQTLLNHLEQARENVTLKTIQKLRDALKRPIADLFKGPG